MRQHRFDAAIAALDQAADHLTKMGADRQAGQTWYDMTAILDKAGDHVGEEAALRHALTCMGLG